MLGVCLALDENDKDKFNYLHKVAKKWQMSMTTVKVTHLAADLGLQQVIL